MCNWRWRDSRRDSSPAGRRKQPALLVTAPQQKLSRFRHRILHPVRIHQNVHLRQLRPGVVAAINWPDAARICLFRFPAVDCDDATGRPRRSSLGDSTGPWISLAFAGIVLPLLLLPSVAAVLLGMVLAVVGTFFAQATATGFVSHAATADRGSASGIYLACYFAGGLVGTAILGQIFDRIGSPACVGGIMLSLGAAAVFALRLRMTPEERSP